MISIRLGNVGSGKSACAVREMYLNESRRKTYSNIRVNLPNAIFLTKDMIVKKEVLGVKRNGEENVKLSLNVEYWQKIDDAINVVIDEAHMIGLNARRSMSKTNQILTQWLSLIRRVLGESQSGSGELVLISQLTNQIDIIARELATNVRWHLCHYTKTCKRCSFTWQENSDIPEAVWRCPMCQDYDIVKANHKIEVWHFANMAAYQGWRSFGMQTFHKHYIINDISRYFNLYNSYSWENFAADY